MWESESGERDQPPTHPLALSQCPSIIRLGVLSRDVAVRVVRQQSRCDDADDRAEKDVGGNRITRPKRREQRRRDQRCWAAGDDSTQLVADEEPL